jgi:ParB/RepB/Spo0J family partition protein
MFYRTQMIDRSAIVLNYPNFVNCRQTIGDTRDLRDSIESSGLMTPPMVWQIEGEDGEPVYVLIAGFRRMQAIDELIERDEEFFGEKFAEINCSIYEGDLDGAQTLNMVENVQRDDLNPADAADAVGRLLERLGTQEKVAAALSMSQPWVSGHFALYRNLCSKAKTALRNGQITLAQSKTLSKLSKKGVPDEEAQCEALLKILSPETAAADAPKKEATSRTFKDLMALRLAVLQDETLIEDPEHRNSVLTVAAWFMLEVSDEEVLERKEFDADYVAKAVAEALEAGKPRGKGRPELTEEEKEAKAAEKAAAAEAKKAERAAAKEAEKAAKAQAKEDEKQARLAAAEAKKAEAAAKAAEKLAATEKRAKERADKEALKAAVAAKAAEKPAKEAPAKVEKAPAEVRRALPVATGKPAARTIKK